MNFKKMLIPTLLAYTFFSFACVYIVLPEGLEAPEEAVEGAELKIWNAVAINVGTSDGGDLHIDLTIQNNTGEWSTMQAVADTPACSPLGMERP